MPPILILVRSGVISPLRLKVNPKAHPRKQPILNSLAQRGVPHNGVVTPRRPHGEEGVDGVLRPGLVVDGVRGGLLDGLEEGLVEVHLADVRDVAAGYGAVAFLGDVVVDHGWGC